MKFLFKFTCIVGLNILFSSHQLHAADVKSLGANKIFALKQYITENPGSAKKWDVYQETINTCVLPLSTQLLTECGLFKLQKVIGVEQYNLVPDEKYFNKALINSSSVKIVELFHSVVFDLLLTGMVDNFNNFYSHMDENQFLGIGDLYPTIIEGSPRPVLTAQDLIDLNDRPTSFQTLQLPYGNATLMNVILILSHMKKEFGGKPAVEFDQITNSLKSAQTLAMHQMKEDGYLNMISSVVNDHWLVTDHANGIKSIMPTVLAEQASEFIQYLRLYQENIGNPYVDAALFVAANDSDKIKKLAQALRGKVGNIEQFLNEATAHIEETFNKIANEGNIHIEQNLISLFEQDSDKKKEQPESLGSYLKSFKTQIINVKNFEDQALIVMYYFDRVLPEINAAQKTVDGIPEHEVFSNLCAFIGRFAHCKTGQAASLGEMITALRQQTTDLAKSEWPDFAIEDEHDNQDALSYIKNVVNDAVQKAKEALFKQTFVQETHEESSSVLLRRNLELCSFIGLPSGSADTFYDRVGVSAWDKVNPVLQALSFYLLKLDPKDFSRVFDENLKHWLPADIEASLKNVIKEASKWQKVVELLPEIVWKQDKQLLHVQLIEVIKKRMGSLSHNTKASISELLNSPEWKDLILEPTQKESAAEMKRRKILKNKINYIKELIKEDVFILEDINNLDASLPLIGKLVTANGEEILDILEKSNEAKNIISKSGHDQVNSLDIEERYFQTKYPDLGKLRRAINAIEASNFGYVSPLMANLLAPMKEVVAEFYKPVLSYNPELNRTEGFSEGASYYLLTHMGFIKDKQLEQEIKFREDNFAKKAKILLEQVDTYQKHIAACHKGYFDLEKDIKSGFAKFKATYNGKTRRSVAYINYLKSALEKTDIFAEKEKLSQQIMAIVFRGLGFGGLSESVANTEECNIMLGSLAATVKAQPADHYDRLEEQAAFYATNGREQDNNKFTFADDVPEQEKKHTQFAFEEVTKTMGRNRDSNIWPFLG